jgi:hypothetical protein
VLAVPGHDCWADCRHGVLRRLDDTLVTLPAAPGPVTAATVTARMLAGVFGRSGQSQSTSQCWDHSDQGGGQILGEADQVTASPLR